MAIKIRKARVSDIPRLVDKVDKFYNILKEKGAKDVALSEDVLRGGITIEIGTGFSNPSWRCLVADNGEDIVAFLVGILEFCGPCSEYLKCVRVHGLYSDIDSIVGPKVLKGMWGLLDEWAKENGAEYYYANVHPGNQPSVRSVKHMGFKHHYTQFFRLVDNTLEEEHG